MPKEPYPLKDTPRTDEEWLTYWEWLARNADDPNSRKVGAMGVQASRGRRLSREGYVDPGSIKYPSFQTGIPIVNNAVNFIKDEVLPHASHKYFDPEFLKNVLHALTPLYDPLDPKKFGGVVANQKNPYF